MALKPVDKQEVLSNLPPEWSQDVMLMLREALAAQNRKLVVLDDDPTGTQTVHSLAVITEWTVDALVRELEDDTSTFYILTNTRSMPLADAEALNREIATNLSIASEQTGRDFAILSRSDSTLRGHFPGEVDALVDALQRDFDGWIIMPFFIEGGRYTIDDIHYVEEGEMLVPAGQTAFAKDKAFAYQASNLTEWVLEKTDGRVSEKGICSISLNDIRLGGVEQVSKKLMSLSKNGICVVNAASTHDAQIFVAGLLKAEAQGKKFIYRTAASFVQARAGLTPQPLLNSQSLNIKTANAGLIVVGSYVPKTTRQLQVLIEQGKVKAVEIDVNGLLDDSIRQQSIEIITKEVDLSLQGDLDVVMFTSRKLITVEDAAGNLSVGKKISDALVAIVKNLQTQPRYILAKGGITSSDVATKGMNVKRAYVLGQILAGVPVWQLGEESRFPQMPYIIFPGNVGDENALATVIQKLSKD
ncbi:MAG: hypothetical protein GY755_13235 [Chloroflexi bacterium]|nr:hypothetical protein [Chloroflexota bacterium]